MSNTRNTTAGIAAEIAKGWQPNNYLTNMSIKALLFKIHVRQGEGQQFAFPDAGPIQDIERGVLTSSAYCAAFP